MKKTKGSPLFCLRPDPLRWSIAGALLLQPLLALGNGLVPVPGPGGTAVISEHNGVPVIAIGAPNAHGLSHNQFSDYNVPVQGLVLNNAVAPGRSVLAGALGANPQFSGQAATRILNEVVGQLPSSVRGTQEVFGQAADYVLANPNGIHIQGVGFINTPRAVFLVGTPELQEGRLTGLNTFAAPGNLHITGAGLNTAAAVDLIAPRIDSQGQLQAGATLTAIAGRNRVTADDLRLVETRQAPGEAPGIDLNALGAMRAGRIRLVSTREGAGIRLAGPEVKGNQGLSVDSAGDLLVGREGEQGRTVLAAVQGTLDLNARRDIRITNSRLAGRDLRAHAGRDLTLDAATREKLEERREAWNKNAWFITTETYTHTTKATRSRVEGSTLTTMGSAELSAGRNLKISASDVDARRSLKIEAGHNLSIEAGVERATEDKETHHRKHLWRGDKREQRSVETATPSTLTAGTITLNAGGKALVRGSQITSDNDLTIRGQSIEIDAQALAYSDARKGYRGDLVSGAFSGSRDQRDETGSRHQGSDVKAAGKVVMVSDDVRIQGSQVKGDQGTLTVGEKGAVVIESVTDVKHVRERNSATQLGGLLGTKNSRDRHSEQALGSTLISEADNNVASATDIRIQGSKIIAAGHNQLDAKGTLHVLSALDQVNETSTTDKGAFIADAGETRVAEDGRSGSKQYYGAVGYQQTAKSQTSQTLQHQASQVTGATNTLTADTLEVSGSAVASIEGDLNVTAREVTIASVTGHTLEETTTSTSKGALKVSGGAERVGSAFTGSHHSEREKTERTALTRASLESEGDINLIASERIDNKGALIKAKGNVTETAQQIHREAIAEVDDRQTQRTGWEGELGASIEWKDLVNPIKKAIEGKEQARFQQPGVEDALVPPSLGADGTVTYVKRAEGLRIERPQVTEVQGAHVQTNAEGSLYDEGTRYTASEGKTAIEADTHHHAAAHERRQEHLTRIDADGGLRVDTSTGHDVNVRLNANGASQQTLVDSTLAVPGSLYGKHGIAVQLGADGIYEGTRFDAGEGAFKTSGEGDLTMRQAENRQHKEQTTTEGYGLLKVGTGPAGKNGLLMGALDHNTLTVTDTQGVAGSIKAATGSIKGAGDVELQGVALNNGKHKTDSFDLQAGGTAKLTAMKDTHRAEGQHLGGALQVGLSADPAATAQRKGGAIGGHIDSGRVNEHSERLQGAALEVRQLTVKAGAHNTRAVSLEGTQLAGESLRLEASNGGVHLEAARSEERKDNMRITVGAGVNGSKGLNKDEDASALYARAKVEVDNVDNTTHTNTDIRVKRLELASAMDTRLTGATVMADKVSGTIGGDLIVRSLQDEVSSTQVTADARFGKEHNPQGLLNGLSAVTGPLADKVKEKVGKPVQTLDQNITPTLLLDVVNEQRNQVANAAVLSAREGIDLSVAGNTQLIGAKLRSSQGKVELGASEVQLTHLSGQDYRADVSINAATGPAELLTNVVNEFTTRRSEQAKADEHGNLGIIRTGGHDKQHTVNAAVEERR